MAQMGTSVILPEIRQTVQQIVDRFQPQKVILFGSYAYGVPTEDSDVDLLVLLKTEENPLYTAARIAAATEHPFPLDIIVFTPSEFEASYARHGSFATEVMTKGITLHETRG